MRHPSFKRHFVRQALEAIVVDKPADDVHLQPRPRSIHPTSLLLVFLLEMRAHSVSIFSATCSQPLAHSLPNLLLTLDSSKVSRTFSDSLER